ncbi:MAG: AAA family ATPase [Nitrospirota bacterium]|nr:AAA family ATPase [Nitrospirota bacterium]MDH5700608.1 AAA family ATPase [Nitrospirota bacterium]
MKDKSWKPKRVGGDSSGIPSDMPVIELSIRSAECQATLEGIIRETDGVRLKESQDYGVPALVIIELEENPEDTFTLIREMGKLNKGTEIFLTASRLESHILLEAMRAGAKEFLAQPLQKQEVGDAILRFLDRGATQVRPGDGQRTPGKVLAFFGGKGGVGTTSIAVNLAAAIKKGPNNPSVVLVDVNQHGGDLPLYLDLQPTHSFRDIATDLSRLDQAFLIRVLTKTELGIQVLPSGYDDLSTGRLSPDCVEATLRLLQASFDYVILDCGHVLDLTTKKALELATIIFVTSTLMVPVVHRTKRILELLRGSGFPAEKIRLVMNRFSPSEQDVLQETEEILKQKAFWLFPNDYPSASQAVNSGKPLIDVAPRSAVAKSYRDLAGSFDEQAMKPASKGSLAGWLNPFKGRNVQSSPSGA